MISIPSYLVKMSSQKVVLIQLHVHHHLEERKEEDPCTESLQEIPDHMQKTIAAAKGMWLWHQRKHCTPEMQWHTLSHATGSCITFNKNNTNMFICELSPLHVISSIAPNDGSESQPLPESYMPIRQPPPISLFGCVGCDASTIPLSLSLNPNPQRRLKLPPPSSGPSDSAWAILTLISNQNLKTALLFHFISLSITFIPYLKYFEHIISITVIYYIIWKDPDAEKDWWQKEMTEGEMVGWCHWFYGHEFEQILGDRGAWCAAVHGVTKNRTWLSQWTTIVIYVSVILTECGKDELRLLHSVPPVSVVLDQLCQYHQEAC